MYIDHVGITRTTWKPHWRFTVAYRHAALRSTRTPNGRGITMSRSVRMPRSVRWCRFPAQGERQHVNHLDYQSQRLRNLTRLPAAPGPWGSRDRDIQRGYGKTFYFHDPNGIRLQIELKTKQDIDSLEAILIPSHTSTLFRRLSAAHYDPPPNWRGSPRPALNAHHRSIQKGDYDLRGDPEPGDLRAPAPGLGVVSGLKRESTWTRRMSRISSSNSLRCTR